MTRHLSPTSHHSPLTPPQAVKDVRLTPSARAVLESRPSPPTPAMNLPATSPAAVPFQGTLVPLVGGRFLGSGRLSGQGTEIPRKMGRLPDATVSLPAAMGANPRPAVAIPARWVAIPGGAVSIPREMGWFPGTKGMPAVWHGMAAAAGGMHTAARTGDTLALGIEPARATSQPGRGGMGGLSRSERPGARSGALECGGKRSATPPWDGRAEAAGGGQRHPRNPLRRRRGAGASRRTPRSLR